MIVCAIQRLKSMSLTKLAASLSSKDWTVPSFKAIVWHFLPCHAPLVHHNYDALEADIKKHATSEEIQSLIKKNAPPNAPGAAACNNATCLLGNINS